MNRAPLSAVVITLDAASQLPACLDSLAFCDEIVVVDSGSRDGTVELARNHGARVIHQDWLGYGPQKQFAVGQAAHDWVLCVDADERVSERLRDGILAALTVSPGDAGARSRGPACGDATAEADAAAVLRSPALRIPLADATPPLRGAPSAASGRPTFSAYRFARCNRFMGRYLRHDEGYPDWSLRLFDRRHARWSDDVVHEKVVVEGAIGTLSGDLLHDSAETLDSYLAKQDRYTTLAAQAALAAGKRASLVRQLLSPIVRFLKFYFLRLGLLDGWPGLVHILIGCRNSYVKYGKMRAFRANRQ